MPHEGTALLSRSCAPLYLHGRRCPDRSTRSRTRTSRRHGERARARSSFSPVTSSAVPGSAAAPARRREGRGRGKLELAASITGDYAAPLFTLARVELFSANPDFSSISHRGMQARGDELPVTRPSSRRTRPRCWYSQSSELFSRRSLRFSSGTGGSSTTRSSRRSRIGPPFRPARWIIGIICVALIFMTRARPLRRDSPRGPLVVREQAREGGRSVARHRPSFGGVLRLVTRTRSRRPSIRRAS